MILTEEMVLSESCGKPCAGANTLYISRKSEEKMIGTVACPGSHVKEGGTVSIKSLPILSKKRSVLKGMIVPALALTLNWFAIKGEKPSIPGCFFRLIKSESLNVLSLPIFSFVMIFEIDKKS